MSDAAKPLLPIPTPEQLRRSMPHLSEKDAKAFVSIIKLCHDKGATIDTLLGLVKEAEEKGLRGGSIFYYAGARLDHEPSQDLVDEANAFQELEDEHGAEKAMKIIRDGIAIADMAKKLGMSAEQAVRAIENGAPLVKLAREHGLDPRVWSEIMREVADDGLKGREAGEALMERFWLRVDRASWAKKGDQSV